MANLLPRFKKKCMSKGILIMCAPMYVKAFKNLWIDTSKSWYFQIIMPKVVLYVNYQPVWFRTGNPFLWLGVVTKIHCIRWLFLWLHNPFGSSKVCFPITIQLWRRIDQDAWKEKKKKDLHRLPRSSTRIKLNKPRSIQNQPKQAQIDEHSHIQRGRSLPVWSLLVYRLESESNI